MEDLFQIGAVTSTHGLRGELKVYPTTDEPARYHKLKEVILDTGKEQLSLKIEHARLFKQMVIIKFEGFDHINEVEKFKGAKLYVMRENALELREDEYYFADLAGLRVETQKDLLIPAIKDCVKQIDLENGRMVIHLLPGLLEASEGGVK